ncbi:MAG: aspartate/glutamate racemase family protein, partial [Oscillospiraceae bacterium]|nr:aspartate/glutamate racemase family protein [Oscillospiraceae bacterium]
MKKALGILGGMGPLATADLFTKIVTMTNAESDREHIRIYIDNNSQITDRTAAILHGGENPLPYMTESAQKLEAVGADCIIMPCNT